MAATSQAVGMNVCILMEQKHPDYLGGGTEAPHLVQRQCPQHTARIIPLDTPEPLNLVGSPPQSLFHPHHLFFPPGSSPFQGCYVSVNYEFPSAGSIPHS